MAKQAECIEFLQWCLPRLRMRWPGFRKVRSQVCKRIASRLRELELEDHDAYKRYLKSNAGEWTRLDAMCRITISRFYRDRGVFEALETEVLPELASAALDRGDHQLKIWSCGCASGEEAYAVTILWEFRVAALVPGIDIKVIATDSDPRMLERARRGNFSRGSLREVPVDLLRSAFESVGEAYRVRNRPRVPITWRRQDVRYETPPGPFDLVLCRNLVLTYFDESLQHEVIGDVVATLRPGGALVIGSHESLPQHDIGCDPWSANLPIYRRVG
jgi:chemotaxis protein methyltransferase CheR